MKKYIFTLLALLVLFTAHAQIITKIAGNGISGNSGDGGPATAAEISGSWGLTVDSNSNVLLIDWGNNKVRKVDRAGIITTYAGNGSTGYGGGDGGPATAATTDCLGLFRDDTGNLYITGSELVRKVNTAGTISTIAGTIVPGPGGYGGDGGPATAAVFHSMYGIAMDGVGNLYIADGDNARIRKINKAGIITTVTGTGTFAFSGDGGPASAADIGLPTDIAIDKAGNLYFSDADSHRIRKIDVAGIITTIAGNGVGAYGGDGGQATAAQLNVPTGVAVDKMGNVYIGDYDNYRVRKVDPSGIISTIVGNGKEGVSGDGGAATAAELGGVYHIRVDCGGNLYIPDEFNPCIRKVIFDKAPYFAGGHVQHLTVCGDTTVNINTLLAATDPDSLQTATWSLLQPPAHGVAKAAYTATTNRGTLTPAGALYTPAKGFIGNDTFKVMVMDCGFLSDTVTIYVTAKNCDSSAGVAFPRLSAAEDMLRVFPNPASDRITVINPVGIGVDGYRITNVMGQAVKEGTIVIGNNKVPISSLSPGSYIITLYKAGAEYGHHIFVKR